MGAPVQTRLQVVTRIKLAGFKSFVDPTSIHFPGNLTGVVGPNGCGKSNIIDAVRWVMGELSAKHLRGDSMADVIFNGSSARKPVGTASIELVFDNSDGAIGGQYASFNEVSLKRLVSRDGTSVYLINGARCRRKDITQLFLGTGLALRRNWLGAVLSEALPMTELGWRKLTVRMTVFLVLLALSNEIVWRTQSESTWVWFETFGLPAALFVFLMANAGLYSAHALPPAETSDDDRAV